MLEAREVAVAAEVERPEPDLVQRLLPFIPREGPAGALLDMLEGCLHRRAVGDRLEQGQGLLRLRRRRVLGLGLVQPVVVEQAAAQVVGQTLVVRDLDLGEQAMRGRGGRALVDPHEAGGGIAPPVHEDRRNAALRLIGVPDALPDAVVALGEGSGRGGQGGSQRRRRSARQPRQKAATIEAGPNHFACLLQTLVRPPSAGDVALSMIWFSLNHQ